jgi:hypothetical protein
LLLLTPLAFDTLTEFETSLSCEMSFVFDPFCKDDPFCNGALSLSLERILEIDPRRES